MAICSGSTRLAPVSGGVPPGGSGGKTTPAPDFALVKTSE